MLLSTVAALALSVSAPATSPAPEARPDDEPVVDPASARYHRARSRLSFASGGILLGWGLTNVAVGVAGNLSSAGRVRYFHQGNWAWNTVNVALGVAGLVGAARGRQPILAFAEGLDAARKSQLVFAINAGLDVVYVASGAAMWQLTAGDETPVGLRVGGYGQALVVQGVFLFGFDVAMMWAHEILISRIAAPALLTRLRPQLSPRVDGGVELGVGLRF